MFKKEYIYKFIQITCPRSAFRLKNILHEWHDITPKYEYDAGASQILHLLIGNFEDVCFIVKISIDNTLFFYNLEAHETFKCRIKLNISIDEKELVFLQGIEEQRQREKEHRLYPLFFSFLSIQKNDEEKI